MIEHSIGVVDRRFIHKDLERAINVLVKRDERDKNNLTSVIRLHLVRLFSTILPNFEQVVENNIVINNNNNNSKKNKNNNSSNKHNHSHV